MAVQVDHRGLSGPSGGFDARHSSGHCISFPHRSLGVDAGRDGNAFGFVDAIAGAGVTLTSFLAGSRAAICARRGRRADAGGSIMSVQAKATTAIIALVRRGKSTKE
jgi:hypothetical protein